MSHSVENRSSNSVPAVMDIKSDHFRLIAVVFVIYSAIYIFRLSCVSYGVRFFSLFDDTMISMRYAHNLASGYGLVWNPGGVKVEGYTNLLWVLYMAIFHLFPIPSSKICLCIQISGLVFCFLNLVVIRKIVRRLSMDSHLAVFSSLVLTAFFLPLNFWSLVGTEVSAITFLTGLAFWLLLKRDRPVLPLSSQLIFGICILLRLDTAPLLILFAAFSFWKTREFHVLKTAAIILVIFAGGQTLFRYLYYGQLLPNTYYLKLTGFPLSLRLLTGLFTSLSFLVKYWVLLALGIYGSWTLRKEEPLGLLAIFVFCTLIAYSTYVGGDAWELDGGSNRFVTPAMPLLFVLFSIGMIRIQRTWPGKGFLTNAKYLVPRTLLFVALTSMNFNAIYGAVAWPEWLLLKSPARFDNVKWIDASHIIQEITSGNATVGVVRSGVVPYFVNRNAIDLLGKCDPKIAREPMHMRPDMPRYLQYYPGHQKWDYAYSLGQLKPDLVVGMWYPTPEESVLINRMYQIFWTSSGLRLYVLKSSTAVNRHSLGSFLSERPN